MKPTGEPPSSPAPETGGSVDLTHGTVQVLDSDGGCAGAGFLVAEQLLVTSAHVLSSSLGEQEPPSEPVSVRFVHLDDGVRTARVDPELWRPSGAEDVAFLRLAHPPPAGAQVLALGSSRGVRGHPVKAFGFPANAFPRGIYGVATVIDEVSDNGNVPLLQLTQGNAITQGFSGGPVLDERTELVVGMVNSIRSPDRYGRGQDTVFITITETLRMVCSELTVSDRNPYRGLDPFTIHDEEWFCGRGRVVNMVLDSLRRERRFVVLVGPSGSGKSSLIHAGVHPALDRGGIPGSDRWGWLSVRPEAEPFAALEREGLPGAGAGLEAAVQRWFVDHPERERLVLVFDQLEELLFTTTPPRLRQALLNELAAVIEKKPTVTVVMALREDFYLRLIKEAPAGLKSLIPQTVVSVPEWIEPGELRAIIEEPAKRAGLTIAPDLVKLIARDAVSAGSRSDPPNGSAAITVLPLLEFALDELWDQREDGRLTQPAYEKIDGLAGGVARWCDKAYGSLTESQQSLARRIITALVEIETPNSSRTRRRRTLAELRSDNGATPQDSGSDFDTVVAELTKQRLLITSSDPTSREPVIELVHDTLISTWGLLRQWLNDDDKFLKWRRSLEDDHRQWETENHDSGRLLRGSSLKEALNWREQRKSDLSDQLRNFIESSDHAERELLGRERRRVQRLRILLAVAVTLTLSVGALAIVLNDQGNLALSRQLASNAQDQLTIDPERSVLLAREAHKVKDTPEAEAALRQASLDSQVRAMLRGHQSTVFGVAFSPDGKRIVSGGEDRTVRVWDASGVGVPVVLHTGQRVFGVAFSADGRRVAGACEDGTVRVWDASVGGPPLVLPGHQGPVLSVAFSPDGRRIVSGGEDRTVRVWDAAGAGEPIVLRDHTNRVYGVAFSPDGKVASASADGTVRVWDASGASQPVVLPGQQGVYSVAFSPDGKRVVSAGKDPIVRVWDASGTGKPLELFGHDDKVLGVAFSADGQRVASASADGTVRLWDASGAGDPVVLRGHQGTVQSVAFSPDGKRVVSAGQDTMVRVWDVSGEGDPVVLTAHQGTVYGVAFSPDGTRVVSSGADGTVRVWDASGAGGPIMLTGHQGTVYGVAFSPDGTRVVSSGADGTVRVWDVSGAGGDAIVLKGHQGAVLGVAFSPDGKRVASAGEDRTVRVWDVSGAGGDAIVLKGHQGQVNGVAFSPDGKRVASAGGDTTVLVWDVSGAGGDPVVLSGHKGTVYGVAFSPDGKRVVSVGADTTVRVWEASGKEDPVVLAGGHHGTVYRVAFSGDGNWIASAGADSTVRIWDASGTDYPVVLHDRRAVRDVALSLDGKRVASGNVDGMVRLWNCEVCRQFAEVLKLAERRSTRELDCEERKVFLHESPCP